MPLPKVLVTRRIPEAVKMIQPHCQVDLWDNDLPIPEEELRRRIAKVDGLYCLLTERVDAAILDAAPNLEVVSNMAVCCPWTRRLRLLPTPCRPLAGPRICDPGSWSQRFCCCPWTWDCGG